MKRTIFAAALLLVAYGAVAQAQPGCTSYNAILCGVNACCTTDPGITCVVCPKKQ